MLAIFDILYEIILHQITAVDKVIATLNKEIRQVKLKTTQDYHKLTSAIKVTDTNTQ